MDLIPEQNLDVSVPICSKLQPSCSAAETSQQYIGNRAHYSISNICFRCSTDLVLIITGQHTNWILLTLQLLLTCCVLAAHDQGVDSTKYSTGSSQLENLQATGEALTS